MIPSELNEKMDPEEQNPQNINLHCIISEFFWILSTMFRYNKTYTGMLTRATDDFQKCNFLKLHKKSAVCKISNGPHRGFGDLGRRAVYFQGAGEHC